MYPSSAQCTLVEQLAGMVCTRPSVACNVSSDPTLDTPVRIQYLRSMYSMQLPGMYPPDHLQRIMYPVIQHQMYHSIHQMQWWCASPEASYYVYMVSYTCTNRSIQQYTDTYRHLVWYPPDHLQRVMYPVIQHQMHPVRIQYLQEYLRQRHIVGIVIPSVECMYPVIQHQIHDQMH